MVTIECYWHPAIYQNTNEFAINGSIQKDESRKQTFRTPRNPNLMLHREDLSKELVNLFFPQQYSAEDPEEDPQLKRSRARFTLCIILPGM